MIRKITTGLRVLPALVMSKLCSAIIDKIGKMPVIMVAFALENASPPFLPTLLGLCELVG